MTRSLPDFCDTHGDLVQVADPLFRDFGATRAFHGPIATIKCHEDNALVRSSFETPGEGRVLVVDGGGSLRRALMGGNLATKAAASGWEGVVIHGAVRDLDELAALDLGIRALATCPWAGAKAGAGSRGGILTFAGVNFTPGHHLYCDADGLVISRNPL